METENETGAEVVETEEVVEETTDAPAEEKKTEETPEAKKSRLERQLKKVNKELGIEDKPKLKKETSKKTDTDNSELSDKFESLTLQVAEITKDSEIELVEKLQKDTGLPIDKLIKSKYFKSELEDLRISVANADATSGIKGDKSGSGNIKQSAEYWIAKGESPTREQVPDRKVRAEIRKAFVKKEGGGDGGQFYNS